MHGLIAKRVLNLPHILPDGSRNAIRLKELKDKLGNWPNANSVVKDQGATAWMLAIDGDGVWHIFKKGSLTRFNCWLSSHGLMRRGLSVAL